MNPEIITYITDNKIKIENFKNFSLYKLLNYNKYHIFIILCFYLYSNGFVLKYNIPKDFYKKYLKLNNPITRLKYIKYKYKYTQLKQKF